MSIPSPLTPEVLEKLKKASVPVSGDDTRCFFVLQLHRESLPPTDEEIQLLHDFMPWCVRLYKEYWQGRILGMEYPGDLCHNTLTFKKREDGTWCYRRSTWCQGPWFVPQYDQPTLTLRQCFGCIASYGGQANPDWEKWKVERPLFTEPAP